MRILHVYKDYHPVVGGIENHIATLGGGQVAAGHEVVVLVTNPDRQPAREKLQGIEVVRASRLFTAASTPVSISMPWLLRRLRPQLVHLHFPYPVGEMSYLGWGRGLPMVITYHCDVVKQQRILRLYKPFLGRVLAQAGRIIASSDAYIQSSPYLRPFAPKCTVIPFAVDNDWFSSGQPRFAPPHQPTIIFLGKHRYYKGVDDLLKAMTRVDARLLVGGTGPEQNAWKQLTADLNITEKVEFIGDIPHEQLPDFYASGSVFVLPSNSRAEAFGKVLQEAMAAGLPCITTELGTGTSFVVRHEESGLVVPPRDPEALAGALNRLLADEDLRRRMGAAGRQRARTEFTRENLVRQVDAVYQELV